MLCPSCTCLLQGHIRPGKYILSPAFAYEYQLLFALQSKKSLSQCGLSSDRQLLLALMQPLSVHRFAWTSSDGSLQQSSIHTFAFGHLQHKPQGRLSFVLSHYVMVFNRRQVAVGVAHSEGRRHHWGRNGVGQNHPAGSIPGRLASQWHAQAQHHCLSCYCDAAVVKGAASLVPAFQSGHHA